MLRFSRALGERKTRTLCQFLRHKLGAQFGAQLDKKPLHSVGIKTSARLGCVRSRVQISPSRPFSFPPFPFPGIYNKRRKTRERRTSAGWVQPEGLKDLYGVAVLLLIRLAILHNRNLRGQLEIDNRLKAAVISKEGRDRLARDYLAEYREILDSQLRYLFIDRQ